MATSTINITLPEELQPYVDAGVEYGSFGTPTDYIRELILDDRDRRIAGLEERLLKNMDSKPISFSKEELDHGDFVELCRKKLQDSK
jgi:antitoxin ParD1/3/4